MRYFCAWQTKVPEVLSKDRLFRAEWFVDQNFCVFVQLQRSKSFKHDRWSFTVHVFYVSWIFRVAETPNVAETLGNSQTSENDRKSFDFTQICVRCCLPFCPLTPPRILIQLLIRGWILAQFLVLFYRKQFSETKFSILVSQSTIFKCSCTSKREPDVYLFVPYLLQGYWAND